MEQLIDVNQAAVLLKVKPLTLYRWRIAGKGPACVKIGRKVLYSLQDIRDFIQSKKAAKQG